MAGGLPGAGRGATSRRNGRIDAGADARLRNAAYVVIPTDLKEGLLHSWNVAYQREIGGNFTAEVAYVGNHGQDIIQRLDLNAGYTLGAGNAGRPQFAQFGRTSSVTAFLPYHTDYHSMQVKVDRRFRNNFLITNSYTLGKGESYDGGDSNGSISTPIDIERSWGRTVNDRQHTFVSSFVYGLPFQKEGWLGAVVNGWQISGHLHRPVGPSRSTSRWTARCCNTPGNTQRPDLTGDPEILGNVGGGQTWFDTTAFAAPAANTFGNLTRNGAGVNAPGLLQPRRLAGEEDPIRPAASPSSASTRSTSPTRCTRTTRTPRSAARRSGRSPARPIRASSGSVSASCSSDHGQARTYRRRDAPSVAKSRRPSQQAARERARPLSGRARRTVAPSGLGREGRAVGKKPAIGEAGGRRGRRD